MYFFFSTPTSERESVLSFHSACYHFKTTLKLYSQYFHFWYLSMIVLYLETCNAEPQYVCGILLVFKVTVHLFYT